MTSSNGAGGTCSGSVVQYPLSSVTYSLTVTNSCSVTSSCSVTLTVNSAYRLTFTRDVVVTGNFAVTNSIAKSSGTFVIDDPIDPVNKLLYHSFVESPDAKNMYDGIATLDGHGEATVRLPAYFDALNGDVRYQLKPVGKPMPDLFVKSEEQNNQFEIGGGAPGGRVSWQITGTRHDAYIEANPIVVEVPKGPGQPVLKGQFMYPEGYSEFAQSSGEFSFAFASLDHAYGQTAWWLR